MKLTKLNYVPEAEKVMLALRRTDKRGNVGIKITTSKIRGLLAMISEIYNEAIHSEGEELSEELRSRIQYLKMHFAYESGRDSVVREFVEKSEIFSAIDSIGKSKEALIIFCHYMEALVAYRKFYGGKDE